MAPNWFMPDKSWSIKCIIHLHINYSFLKGLRACIIRRTGSCIFKFPLFRATQSVIISAGMPIRKYNSSQGCKTTAINHTTKPQRFTKDENVKNLKYVCFLYAVMLAPSETGSFIVALTPLVFRFCISLTIMFMSQHDASLFIRFKARPRAISASLPRLRHQEQVNTKLPNQISSHHVKLPRRTERNGLGRWVSPARRWCDHFVDAPCTFLTTHILRLYSEGCISMTYLRGLTDVIDVIFFTFFAETVNSI